MAQYRRFAAFASLTAAVSMAATPIAAAEIPIASAGEPYATPGVFDADSENVQRHRYYRYRHRHRNRVDAGDVIAGVLILGGIAAIASAASRNDRDRRYREREYRRDRNYDYRERRDSSRYDGARGIDRAVEMCVSRIERNVRVNSVDSVDRTGEGWRVTGRLYNGESFNCSIGSDGRIEGVAYGSVASSDNRQLSDERYRTAWAEVDRERASQSGDEGPRPAYPGGPLPGEEEADDRYNTAE